MKKLNATGFKISAADQKALDHYLLTSAKSWSVSALAGMINKAVKTILRDWFEVYKAKQTEGVSADIAVIIPAIIAMTEFKPYNTKTPEIPIVSRKEDPTQEIWDGGFDVEDYEEAALRAFYEDPEAMLEYFMENKVHARKQAFVKEKEAEMIRDKSVETIPSKQDDMINLVCDKPGYKNRAVREAEEQARLEAEKI